MTDYYVDTNGVQQGGFGDGAVPESGEFPADWVKATLPPNYADQIWDNTKRAWGSSRMQAALTEDQWRLGEVDFTENQILLIQVSDPSALPGTQDAWTIYLAQVKLWKDGRQGFPDSNSRPVRP